MSRRVWKERRHLEHSLPSLLRTDPSLQLWFVTAAAEDSPDIHTTAKAAVLGVRRLVRHPRLKKRVVGYFAALEVAHRTSREHPCAHVHAVLVTFPMDKGRHRISEADWVGMWEECCPLARGRDRAIKMLRYARGSPKPNLSIVVQRVSENSTDITRVIRYSTKWATADRIANHYRALLIQPDRFIWWIQSLRGIHRFFGDLHLRPSPAPPKHS